MPKLRSLTNALLPWLAFCVAFVIASFATNELFFEPSSRVEAERQIDSEPKLRYLKTIERHFPEEGAALREEFIDIVQTAKSSDQAFRMAGQLTSEFMRRHASSLRHAPDELLLEILSAQVALVQPLTANSSLCNRMLMLGGINLEPSEASQVEIGKFDFEPLIAAIKIGGEMEHPRLPATDDDLVTFFEFFQLMGGTQADLESISSGQIDDPNLCKATIRFMETAIAARFEGADRVRAEVVVGSYE